MRRRLLLALIAASLAIPTVGSADIFVYHDPSGVLRFTSAPTEAPVERSANGLSAWPQTNWSWRTWRWWSGPLGRIDGARRQAYDPIIRDAAARHRVEMALVKAVIRAESDFVPHAVSPKGALGLMQLMPATARRHNVSRAFEPRQNVDGGVRHLRYLLDRYNGNTRLALAAYNAGEGAVDRHGGIPPYRETRTYVQRVLQYRNAYLGDS